MAENNNVVESLEIDVTLNTSQYDKASAEVTKKTDDLAKTLDKSSKGTDQMHSSVKSLVGGLGRFFGTLAVATGLEKLVNDVAQANDQLGFLEKQLGSNAQTIKAWQGAVQAGGGSVQGLNNSFKTLTQGMQTFVTYGDTSMLTTMNALGVSMVDAQGHIRKTDDVMLDLADTMSHMDSTQAYMLGGKLGLDDGTIGTLIQGRDALKESIAYQKTLYQSSEQDIKNSRELQKNRALLNSQWESFKTMLANQFIPIAIKVSEVILSIFETMQKHKATIEAVFGGLAVILSASIIPLFTRALTPLLGFIAPFAPFIAVVAALGAAFIALYDDYKTWAEGGKSLFDWGALKKFMDENEFSAKNLGEAFSEIGKQLKEQTMPTLKEYMNILKDLLNGDFNKAGEKTGKMVDQFSKNAIDVVAKATGEKAEDIGGFIGESAYKLFHGGKTYNEYNNIPDPITAPTPIRKQNNGGGKKGTFGAEVAGYIKDASSKFGIDEKTLRGFVQMEGGYNGAMSPTGAIGVGQFTQDTWNGLAKTAEGRAIGMTAIDKSNFRKSNDPRYNQQINTMATALLAKQNAEILRKNGLEATGENLYLMHNMGGSLIPAMKGSNAINDKLRHNIDVNVESKKRGISPVDFVAYQKQRFNANYNTANIADSIQPSIPQSTVTNNTNTQTGGNTSNEVNIQSITVNSSSDKVSGTIQDAVFGAQQAWNPLIKTTH